MVAHDEVLHRWADFCKIDRSQVGPASIDLRLGSDLKAQSRAGDWAAIRLGAEGYSLKRGQFYLAHSAETIDLRPPWGEWCAIVHGKSSLARMGLMVHCAGFVDPGFVGQLTFEVINLGMAPIEIHAGMKFAQVTLHKLEGAPLRPYGMKGPSYNGQTGATPAAGGRWLP